MNIRNQNFISNFVIYHQAVDSDSIQTFQTELDALEDTIENFTTKSDCDA